MTVLLRLRTGWTLGLRKLAAWFGRVPPAVDDDQRARDLIAAVDAGGIPLNPARVNAIARALGLEVSSRARVEDTVARIRAALERLPPGR